MDDQGLLDKIKKEQIGVNADRLFSPVLAHGKTVEQFHVEPLIGDLMKGEDGTKFRFTGNGWMPEPTREEIVKSLPSGEEPEVVSEPVKSSVQKYVVHAKGATDEQLLMAIEKADDGDLVKASVIVMDIRYPGFIDEIGDYIVKGGRKDISKLHQKIVTITDKNGRTFTKKVWVGKEEAEPDKPKKSQAVIESEEQVAEIENLIEGLDPKKEKDQRLFYQLVDELQIDHGVKYDIPEKWKGDKTKKGEVLDLANVANDTEFRTKSEQFFSRHTQSVRGVLEEFKKVTGRGSEILMGALSNYQHSSYDAVNKYLRYGDVNPEMVKVSENTREEYVKNMDDEVTALDYLTTASKLNEGVVVYRGIRWDDEKFNKDIADVKVGTKWEDFGFQSTSLNEEVAQNFSGSAIPEKDKESTITQVLLRITIKEGQSALPVKSVSHEFDEHEILLPRGKELRVTKVEDVRRFIMADPDVTPKLVKIINLEYYE